ncbi:bifunctional transcriptional activator/DNA repair enzyme AdaA [Planococcus maritimus]|uniref:bifunctional transcriptional activator/DNA repair enzyme AdaA n=1 Tax=Planococcus maritimus TaxID=192421 RepID=UPI000797D805|nr:Ada metal-binding domain-containing protein [Planococcus maritimus]KYG58518.1 adenosine deaminase [Planococcus maritimus]
METKTKFTFDEMWEKILDCDRKYDGLFYTCVKTTKIYCRPSCRSRKPKKRNVEFCFSTEEAEHRGFRACKRCQPEIDHSPHVEFNQQVISFLTDHYQQKIGLEEVAAHVGMSSSYVDRLFKQETGDTPRSYLEKVRIDKAAHLLASTDQTNLEICLETGFHSTSHFYKVFRKHKQQSPGEYRKEKGVPRHE